MTKSHAMPSTRSGWRAFLNGLFAIVALAAVLAASGASAATDKETSPATATETSATHAPDTHEPTTGQLAAARDMIAAMDIGTLTRGVVDAMTPAMLADARRNNPNLTQEQADTVAAIIHQEFEKHSSDLGEMFARVYAAHFSESELRQLAAFYRSDVGRKYLATVPAITGETMPLAIAWGQRIAAQIRERLSKPLQPSGEGL